MPNEQSVPYDAISRGCLVGALPSSGSSSAPVSRSVTHVRTPISLWRLEIYLTKIHYFPRSMGELSILDFIRNCALAYLIRFDATPIRVYVDRILETCAKICAMGAVLSGSGGVSLELFPTPRNRPNAIGTCLTGAIHIAGLEIEEMRSYGNRRKALSFAEF